MNHVSVFIWSNIVHEIEQQADVGFSRNQSFLHVMLGPINECTLQVN